MIPVKSGRFTIYLDPSISVEDLTDAPVNLLLSQKIIVKFWYYLLFRTVSCDIAEIEELITALDGFSKGRSDFINPKKLLKVNGKFLNLSFSFPVDVLRNASSNASFDELWPQLCD